MSFVYRGLEAKFERYTVTDRDVEHQLQHILAENPKCEHITDRPAQLGDEVVLDYAGFCEGEQFAGGTAEGQHLVLGSGRFIPGFEEQLVGKKIGEEVSVMVTFPEAYHAENLAGKPAEFRCKIHEIHVHSSYELNDEFAKEFGECETMEEFREKLKASMQAYSDERTEMELQERLLNQAAETLEFTPTEEQIEKEIDAQLGGISAQLEQQGMNLEMYCQFTGTSLEQVREGAKESAVMSLRMQAAIDEIAALENIEVADGEIDDALEVVARHNNMPLEEIKKFCNEEMEKELIHSILIGKVMRLIRDSAVVTEECCHCHCHGDHCHDDHCHDDHCDCHDDHCHGDHCHCH